MYLLVCLLPPERPLPTRPRGCHWKKTRDDRRPRPDASSEAHLSNRQDTTESVKTVSYHADKGPFDRQAATAARAHAQQGR